MGKDEGEREEISLVGPVHTSQAVDNSEDIQGGDAERISYADLVNDPVFSKFKGKKIVFEENGKESGVLPFEDIFSNASRFEAGGNRLMEAGALGKKLLEKYGVGSPDAEGLNNVVSKLDKLIQISQGSPGERENARQTLAEKAEAIKNMDDADAQIAGMLDMILGFGNMMQESQSRYIQGLQEVGGRIGDQQIDADAEAFVEQSQKELEALKTTKPHLAGDKTMNLVSLLYAAGQEAAHAAAENFLQTQGEHIPQENYHMVYNDFYSNAPSITNLGELLETAVAEINEYLTKTPLGVAKPRTRTAPPASRTQGPPPMPGSRNWKKHIRDKFDSLGV